MPTITYIMGDYTVEYSELVRQYLIIVQETFSVKYGELHTILTCVDDDDFSREKLLFSQDFMKTKKHGFLSRSQVLHNKNKPPVYFCSVCYREPMLG